MEGKSLHSSLCYQLIIRRVGHYKALEWVEDAKEWKINNDMGVQVTVEVRSRSDSIQ